MKILFTNDPIETKNFIYGLESDDAIDEFKSLFSVSSFENRNFRFQIPTEEQLKTVAIQSFELKNFLVSHAGQTVLFLCEKSTQRSTETRSIVIPVKCNNS